MCGARLTLVMGIAWRRLRAILDFCDLEWHRDCERYFEKHRRIATASFNQANKPIYQSSVGKWRRYEPHLKPLIAALAG